MKQMAFSKVLTALTCALVLCMSVPTLAVADQATYLYDDLGRLSQVIDGQGNVATYAYDAVGNLLAITRTTGGVGTPTITGLTPGMGESGTTVTVTLTGTNLSGATVATDNPGLVVRNVVTTPTSLTASFVVAHTARVGVTAVTVRTSLGTAGATFAVTAGAPVLTSLSPTSGPVTRVVTLSGAGFSAGPSANLVRFNGTAATPISATPMVVV